MESANQFSLLPPGGLLPPKGLNAAMEGLVREVILKNPKDIYKFAADYFEKLISIRSMASSVENEEINNLVYYHQYNENKSGSRTVSATSRRSKTSQNSILKKIDVGHSSVDEKSEKHEILRQSTTPSQQNLKISNEKIEFDNSPESLPHSLDMMNLEEEFKNTNISGNIRDDVENKIDNFMEQNNSENQTNKDNSNTALDIQLEQTSEGKMVSEDNLNDIEEDVLKINLEAISDKNSETSNIDSEGSNKSAQNSKKEDVEDIKLESELTMENYVSVEEVFNENEILTNSDIDEVSKNINAELNEGMIDISENDKIIATEGSNNNETSETETNTKESTIDTTLLNETPVDLATIEIPTVEVPTLEELTAEVQTVELSSAEKLLISELTVVELPTIEVPPIEEPSVDQLTVSKEPSVEELSMDLPTIEVPIEESTVETQSIEISIFKESTVEEPTEISIIELTNPEDFIENVAIKKPSVEEPIDDEGMSDKNDIKVSSPEIKDQVVIEHLSTTINDEEIKNETLTNINDSPDNKISDEFDNNDDPNEYELKISLENKSGIYDVSENNTTMEEKNNKINADENLVLEKYVTIIQKVFRGFITRKKVTNFFKKKTTSFSSKEKDPPAVYNTEQNYGITHASIDPLLYTVPEEKIDSSSTEEESSTFSSAATKIQAGVRGFLTRKYFQRNKTNTSSDTTAPSIGEDSKSFEDLGNILESDDTVSKIIVATSSLLIEQLEHFEKLENKASSKDTLDVNTEQEEGLNRARKKLRREDAIQLNSPCSSEETEKNKYSPGKTSEDEEPIGDLATSIITEIISNTYTPVVEDIDSNQRESNELEKENIDSAEKSKKDDSDLEEVNAESTSDISNKDGNGRHIVQSESFQSDDCDVVSGPIIQNKATEPEQKTETTGDDLSYDNQPEKPITQEIPEDFSNVPISEITTDEAVASSIPNSIVSIEKTDMVEGTKSKESIEEIKGLLHSGEFHDTIVLPTKVVRQSSHKSKGMLKK